MKKTDFDSIIFDLDGTMWDSADVAAVVWKKIADEYPEITDVVDGPHLKALYGLPLEDIAVKLFASVPKAKAIEVMNRCVVDQCPYLAEHGAVLLGDIKGTLTKLREKGYHLSIVSNCKDGYIQAFMTAHDLWDLFDDFECPGRTGKLKAENNRMVIERNHLKNPIYVGDTMGDYVAAKKCGLPFVWCRYGFGEVETPDYVIDSFEELNEIL